MRRVARMQPSGRRGTDVCRRTQIFRNTTDPRTRLVRVIDSPSSSSLMPIVESPESSPGAAQSWGRRVISIARVVESPSEESLPNLSWSPTPRRYSSSSSSSPLPLDYDYEQSELLTESKEQRIERELRELDDKAVLGRQLGQLRSQLADHQCPICLETLTEPVNLPCGVSTSHAICKGELLRLADSQKCPLCSYSLQAWMSNVRADNLNDYVNKMRGQYIESLKKKIRIAELRLERAKINAEIDALKA